MKLTIKPSDRVSVIGMTGTGKTTILKALLYYWIWATREWFPYHIVILDTKKDGDFDGMGKKFTHLKDLNRLWDDHRILIYEPIEEEMNDEFYDGFFTFLRKVPEPLLLVIDELASVAKGTKVSQGYELLMKQGRGKNKAVWSGIQNPVYIPHDFLSNANHFFTFDLLMDSDRDKMSGIVGKGVMVPPPVKEEGAEHGFYYFSVKTRRLEFYKNEPQVKFPVPAEFDPKSAIRFDGEPVKPAGGLNWYLIGGVLVIAIIGIVVVAKHKRKWGGIAA